MSARLHVDLLGAPRYYVTWWALAFLSGAVNVGGLIACHRTVTHVTGFVTQFGKEFGEGQAAAALGILSVPLFFLLGAMISALLVDRRKHLNKRPRYAVAMWLVFLCLLVAWWGGVFGFFGVFGEPFRHVRDYVLLAVLCLASGIQNAVITSASGAVVRTTHLTGITTDLGVGLVRVIFPSPDEGRQRAERKSNRMRVGIIAGFLLGSAAGAVVFPRWGYHGFALPAAVALYGVCAAYFLWERVDWRTPSQVA
jgi:uncharacterized membrane protein YoaK (UPF0700 family)